jgi:zinc transporter ZupT
VHSLLGLTSFLALVAMAFGKRAAAICAAVILGLGTLLFIAIAYALLWPEGSWLDRLLYHTVT